MGTVSIRVSEELYKKARMASTPNTRSINQQVEHWSKIGRIAEANPDLTFHVIKDFLMGKADEEAGLIDDYIFEEK